MNIKLGTWTLTIELNHDTATAARRQLARKVERLMLTRVAKQELGYTATGKIARIKVWRSLTAGGLLEGKLWVESAFTDNGSGKVI